MHLDYHERKIKETLIKKMFRTILKSRNIIYLLIIFLIMTCFLYLYSNEKPKDVIDEHRCLSELASVRYQLNVVTEYKKKADKLLLDTQKEHGAVKEKFKDIVENCVAIKQQSAICQDQFEDIKNECKKLKDTNIELLIEMEKLKTNQKQN